MWGRRVITPIPVHSTECKQLVYIFRGYVTELKDKKILWSTPGLGELHHYCFLQLQIPF